MDEVLKALQQSAIGPMTRAELVGDVTGALCVWLVARQHILNWPLGLLNNVFFFLIFWWSKLYGDAVLQAVFAALGVYGWIVWARGDAARRTVLPVRHTTRVEWTVLAPLTAAATVVAALWLSRKTDSPVPLWDASVLTLSLAATYGQAMKLLESWWIWIAVDVLSIPLYIVRGLYPTALLYAVFLALCIVGLRAWTRELAPASRPGSAEAA